MKDMGLLNISVEVLVTDDELATMSERQFGALRAEYIARLNYSLERARSQACRARAKAAHEARKAAEKENKSVV